jgi:hypothetical protein
VEEKKQAELDPHIPAEVCTYFLTYFLLYLSLFDQDHAFRKEILQKNGLAAPMCWYKAPFADLEIDESKRVSPSSSLMSVTRVRC